jgi:formate hydrogenlyase subunit 6/NADH:ubiquinone oxidoreductase subunit I
MILNRDFFHRTPLLRMFWSTWQKRQLRGEKVFRALRLHRTEYPEALYFYSPRLRRRPVFSGNRELLASWKDAELCARLCPTRAITALPDDFIIDPKGCIACGLCVEMAPPGLLVVREEG